MRSGFSRVSALIKFHKTMAACLNIDPEVASLFGDSGDEESFDGFGEGVEIVIIIQT